MVPGPPGLSSFASPSTCSVTAVSVVCFMRKRMERPSLLSQVM